MARRTPQFQWTADKSETTTFEERPSRSAKKRMALSRQKLGEELCTLSRTQLKELALPEELIEALVTLTHLSSHEAVRRHKQYIGRLMRDLSEEEISQLQFAMANRK